MGSVNPSINMFSLSELSFQGWAWDLDFKNLMLVSHSHGMYHIKILILLRFVIYSRIVLKFNLIPTWISGQKK